MVIFVVLAMSFAGCGSNQAIPEESSQPTEQTPKQSETANSKQDNTVSKDQNIDKSNQIGDQANSKENGKPGDQQAKPDPKGQQQETKLYYEGEFDGKNVKCQLPEKWIAKDEQTEYGIATIMLDPAQNAGVSLQVVENNKDTLQARAEGIANQFGGKIVGEKLGKYDYKRITTIQKDPKTNKDVTVDYLICVVGSKAYYLATPIFDQAATKSLISGLQYK